MQRSPGPFCRTAGEAFTRRSRELPVLTLGQVPQGVPLAELPDDKLLIVARGADKEIRCRPRDAFWPKERQHY
jgi:hypothetical protein